MLGPRHLLAPGQALILSRGGGAAGTAGPGLRRRGGGSLTLFPAFFLPGHLFNHGLGQVNHEKAQQEKDRKGDKDLQAGGQIHVIQDKPVEKVHRAAAEHGQQGEHIDQGRKENVGDAAAAGAPVLALAL